MMFYLIPFCILYTGLVLIVGYGWGTQDERNRSKR